MNKEDFILLLKSKGYKCIYENNMPIVLVKSREEITENLIKIKEYVKLTGYDYSWGISVQNDRDIDD